MNRCLLPAVLAACLSPGLALAQGQLPEEQAFQEKVAMARAAALHAYEALENYGRTAPVQPRPAGVTKVAPGAGLFFASLGLERLAVAARVGVGDRLQDLVEIGLVQATDRGALGQVQQVLDLETQGSGRA